MMDIAEALQIVIDLARQNIIDDPDMQDEANLQRDAINAVEHVMEKWFGSA